MDSLFLPILNHLLKTKGMEACVGDWKGSSLSSHTGLSTTSCSNFPLETSHNYGFFGFDIKQFPCGDPTQVTACLGFDSCGTVVISVNGGIASCLAHYGTAGMADLLTPIAKVISSVTIGISIPRRFTTSFMVARRVGASVMASSITTRGSFYFSGVITALPGDYFSLSGYDMKDVFDITAKGEIFIDFGDMEDLAKKSETLITKPSSKNKDGLKNVITSLANLGAELTIIATGGIYLKLESLTQGLFVDFSFDLRKTNILITRGGGSSGLDTGLYFNVSSDQVASLGGLLNMVFSQFGGVLSRLGVVTPKISPSLNISLGIFITTDSVGFEFSFAISRVSCYFNFKRKVGGCQFDNKFFAAIIEKLTWVYK
jgi:hypothetical protein